MSGSISGRRRAVITGASGGIGRACARCLGETMDLVLTDVAAEPLETFATALEEEGFTVRAQLSGDLCDEALLSSLAETASGGGGLGVLVHTAGLSPALARWEPIMRVNLVATAKLLAEIEPLLIEKSVAILIASIAGHLSPTDPEADAIIDDPLAPDLIERIAPVIQRLSDLDDPGGAAHVSYALSKRAVLRICEQRVSAWAIKGARIVSISPGTIWTPMGRREAEDNPSAALVVKATPAGRWGTAMDIAAAARFITSEAASFISGTDLRVDGGVTPFLRSGQADS